MTFAVVAGAMLLSGSLPSAASVRAPASFPGKSGKIAFVSGADGNGEIVVMDPDGTGKRQLTNRDPFGQNPSWSPDGSQIVFDKVSEEGGAYEVWIVNVRGGKPRRVLSHPSRRPHLPVWAPDGKRIAFAEAGDIFVVGADGKGLRQLTRDRSNDDSPAWAPRGGSIAFARGSPGRTRIWVVRADGSQPRALGPGADPSWSPSGRQLVFSAPTRGSNSDLWIMGADGSGRRRLTDTPGVNEHDPAWSRRGRIAFNSNLGITTIGQDGRGRKLAVRGGFSPTWSPRGTRLGFERYSVGHENPAIFTARVDGKQAMRLLSPAVDENPAWSPDGRQLAFSSRRPFGRSGIYLVGADGPGERLLRKGGAHPTWSPDGARIVYTSGGSLFVTNSDGTGARALAPLPVDDESGVRLRAVDPVWSPRGNAIALGAAENSGCSFLYLVAPDGSSPRRLTTACVTSALRPDWSPDGERIALGGKAGQAAGEIAVVNADGSGTTVYLTRTNRRDETSPVWSPDGARIVFAGRDGLAGLYDIYVMSAGGGTTTRIARDARHDLAWQAVR